MRTTPYKVTQEYLITIHDDGFWDPMLAYYSSMKISATCLAVKGCFGPMK